MGFPDIPHWPPEGSRAVADFDPEPWFANPKEARRTDRFAQFALAVAQMALDQAYGWGIRWSAGKK